jgi:hypothetical protein
MISRTAAIAAFETIQQNHGEVRLSADALPETAGGILADLREATDAEVASTEVQSNLRTVFKLTGDQAAFQAERLSRGAQSSPAQRAAYERAAAIASVCSAALAA